jgi:O-antigen/teichoic acid export membrane protein
LNPVEPNIHTMPLMPPHSSVPEPRAASAERSLRFLVLKSASVLAASQVVISLLTFLSYRIILGTLTKEEHGELFFVQQLGSFLMLCFAEAGMTTVTLGMVIHRPDTERRTIATLFKLRLMLGVAVSVLFVGLAAWYGWQFAPLFALSALGLLIAARSQVLRGALELRRKARSEQIPAAAAALSDAALLLAFLWFDREHLTTLTVLMWFVLASLPGLLGLLLLDKQWRTVRAAFDRERALEIVRAAFPVFVVVLMQQAHMLSDAFFLDLFCSKTEVGVYGAASRLMQQSVVLVLLLGQALFPVIARLSVEDVEQARTYMLHGVRASIVMGLAFGMFAAVAVEWLIWLSAGDQYRAYTNEFALFAFAVVPGFVQTLLLTLTTAIAWQHRNYVIFAVLVVVSLVGNLTLTPLYGTLGAITTKFIALLGSSVVALRVMSAYCGTAPVRRLSWQAVSGLVLCAAWVLGLMNFSTQIPSTFVRFLLTIPIFVGILLLTRLVTNNEWRMIAQALESVRERLRRPVQ